MLIYHHKTLFEIVFHDRLCKKYNPKENALQLLCQKSD